MDRVASMTAFVKVVDLGGFSAAARRLNMSPTMVSNHVQALEDRLGARLLNRTTRRVSLTEVGRSYYERCAQILADIEEADRAAGSLQTTPRGLLRVNTSTVLAGHVGRAGAEFTARYPEVSFNLVMTDRMVDLVEEAFDVAIRLAPTADSSMVVRPLVTFRFVVSGAPAYFARRPAPARPADLAEHNCLRYSFFPPGREWTFTGPDGAESVRISGNLETNSADALRAAALGGQGVLLSPGFLVAQDLSAGRLVPALTDYQAPQLPISAIYPHRRLLSAKVRHFIDLVALRFADEAFWRG